MLFGDSSASRRRYFHAISLAFFSPPPSDAAYEVAPATISLMLLFSPGYYAARRMLPAIGSFRQRRERAARAPPTMP